LGLYSDIYLLARATALHNCELPCLCWRFRRERIERAKGALISVGMESRMTTSPTSFPEAAPARGIARALVTAPPSSWPTNHRQPRLPTGLEIMALLNRLHSEGNTSSW